MKLNKKAKKIQKRAMKMETTTFNMKVLKELQRRWNVNPSVPKCEKHSMHTIYR